MPPPVPPPSPFRLAHLPPELILHIAHWLPVHTHRLGLPTGSLDTRLAGVFRAPTTIAPRAVRHYGTAARAVVWEAGRGCGVDGRAAVDVVEAIVDLGVSCRRRGGVDVDWNERVKGYGGVWTTAVEAVVGVESVEGLRGLVGAGGVDVARCGSGFSTRVWGARRAGGGTRTRTRTRTKDEDDNEDADEDDDGSPSIAKLLLDNGYRNDEALVLCSTYGRIDHVRRLLANGAVVDPPVGRARWVAETMRGHALQAAARNGHCDVVCALLDSGRADVHMGYDKALWMGVRKGRVEVVKVLLKRGADRSGSWVEKWWGIRRAHREGYEEVLELVLGTGHG
ncbi:hypothetical protein HDU93_008526 [Gonapodya sp. JEL0774]|nr:hypothetical protein HDU93_008526 [Gonapodya sp. JEL0774]